jgi:tRNA pseudouridine32 synthase/23S rRNA pseudouridine746 synthase
MRSPHSYQPPAHSGLDVLYEDNELVIVNKPAGLLSVPGRGEDKQDCMLHRLQTEFKDAQPVHRLDMDTSGILLFARNADAQRAMSRLFEQRRIHKAYLANVWGLPSETSGSIHLPLIADWPNRPRQKIDFTRGKAALTHYQLIMSNAQHSLLKLTPVTGRSHQLRVHMSALGHPILGDPLYGTALSRGASQRLLLHAEQLAFAHPFTGQAINLQCHAEFTLDNPTDVRSAEAGDSI